MPNSDLTSAIPTHIKSKELVQKRREQIILAAIKLFSRKGFVKTTLKDLAEEAGLSYGNIYDYVGNKEDIFVLVHEFITGLADEELKISTNNIIDPMDKLRKMIRSEFDLSYRWADTILFIYQDIHILERSLLKKLLRKESDHVRKFMYVLDECIENDLLRPCNTRIVSNLIKIMIDSWVIKRWDLKGISQFQMENTIINLVFNGLAADKPTSQNSHEVNREYDGKTVLIINGGTVFNSAISTFLLSKGARLAIYYFAKEVAQEFPGLTSLSEDKDDKIKLYSSDEHGPLSPDLLKTIESEIGQLDVIVHDIGASDFNKRGLKEKRDLLNERLWRNMEAARVLCDAIENESISMCSRKILFIAPWSWDKYIDSVTYATIKASVIALTQTMSQKRTDLATNVNCLLPGHIGGAGPLNIPGDENDTVGSKRPLGQIADIVHATDFLISDVAKYITGQIISVDGGYC